MALIRHSTRKIESVKSSIKASTNKNGTLRKLGICGSNQFLNKNLFCFPENLDELISQHTAVKMSKRLLHRISCGIYETIGSI
jgi:hypothetical protein